jgi:uncharacterized lipoprotein
VSAHCIYPGEYFILKRDAGRVEWDLLFRDDSKSTMSARYHYQVERLRAGEAVRFEDPTGKVIAEAVL